MEIEESSYIGPIGGHGDDADARKFSSAYGSMGGDEYEDGDDYSEEEYAEEEANEPYQPAGGKIQMDDRRYEHQSFLEKYAMYIWAFGFLLALLAGLYFYWKTNIECVVEENEKTVLTMQYVNEQLQRMKNITTSQATSSALSAPA